MAQVLSVLDPGTRVKPTELAAAWDADGEAKVAGPAWAETISEGVYLPGVTELIVVPLADNLASSAAYDLVRKLVTKLRPQREEDQALEVTAVTTRDGDRVVVVRSGGTRS
jgi:hypothetical protein